MSDTPKTQIISTNRKARHRYHILESFEAGIQLTGREIKSIREGNVSIEESYIRPEAGEVFWVGAHIKPYTRTDSWEYNPTRARKLLLRKSEIEKLTSRVATKGLTVVPLQLYLKRGKAKLEIALARGKDAPDKREAIREREDKREADRARKKGLS
jgi:SsrA-binding protein